MGGDETAIFKIQADLRCTYDLYIRLNNLLANMHFQNTRFYFPDDLI